MNIREYLTEMDMSVADFSAISGVTYSSVYNYMNETHRPTRNTATRIEEATGGKVKAKDLRKIVAVKRKKNEPR